MKIILRVSLTVLVWHFLNISSVAELSQNDHLAPIRWNWDQMYRQLLTKKLGVTPFAYGRVFIKPSFEAESSISLFCNTAPKGEKCYVTYLVAAKNLWQATNGGNIPENAKSVKVRRVDIEIPKEAADAVKDAFSQMLLRTKSHSRGDERALPIDATNVEFALQRGGNRPLAAQANPFLPRQGKNVTKLLELAQDLESYCKVESSKRPLIKVTIERKAKELISSAEQ